MHQKIPSSLSFYTKIILSLLDLLKKLCGLLETKLLQALLRKLLKFQLFLGLDQVYDFNTIPALDKFQVFPFFLFYILFTSVLFQQALLPNLTVKKLRFPMSYTGKVV